MFFSENCGLTQSLFPIKYFPEHAFSKTNLKNLFQGAELKSEPGLEMKEKEAN